MIRVLIADDQEMFRVGLRTVLAAQDGMLVVGEASDGAKACALASQLIPDIVLMDLRMPKMDGIAAIAEIGKRGLKTRSLVLTTFEDAELLNAALEAGASGYILKGTPVDDLADLIRLVHKGFSPFSPGLAQSLAMKTSGAKESLAADVDGLSERERDIFALLGTGMTNRQIAEQLHLSDGTVRNLVSAVLAHLHLRHRTEAALLANHVRIRSNITPASTRP
jgi:DNA-binding NarL/FixJ family response regulator